MEPGRCASPSFPQMESDRERLLEPKSTGGSQQTGRKMKPQKPRASRKKANVDVAALKIPWNSNLVTGPPYFQYTQKLTRKGF